MGLKRFVQFWLVKEFLSRSQNYYPQLDFPTVYLLAESFQATSDPSLKGKMDFVCFRKITYYPDYGMLQLKPLFVCNLYSDNASKTYISNETKVLKKVYAKFSIPIVQLRYSTNDKKVVDFKTHNAWGDVDGLNLKLPKRNLIWWYNHSKFFAYR